MRAPRTALAGWCDLLRARTRQYGACTLGTGQRTAHAAAGQARLLRNAHVTAFPNTLPVYHALWNIKTYIKTSLKKLQNFSRRRNSINQA